MSINNIKKFGRFTAEHDSECNTTFVFCRNFSASLAALEDTGVLEDRHGNTLEVPPRYLGQIVEWEASLLGA